MKKLIVITGIMLSVLAASAQRYVSYDTLNTGASDTVNYTLWDKPGNMTLYGAPLSYQLDYRDADTTTVTLGLYGSNFHPDSGLFIPLHWDINLDGVNDNPITLSDTADTEQTFGIDVELFLYQYFIRRITRNGMSDSTNLYEVIIQ